VGAGELVEPNAVARAATARPRGAPATRLGGEH
jgi:hypothetical protein